MAFKPQSWRRSFNPLRYWVRMKKPFSGEECQETRRRQSSRSFGGRQGALFLGKPQAGNFGLGSHNLDSKHSQTLYLHHCGFPPSRAELLVSVSRKLQCPLLILPSGPEATGGRGLVAAPASVSAGCASSRGSAPVDKRDSSRLAWLPPLTCFFFLSFPFPCRFPLLP